jgi:hypothetical protein
MESNERLVSMLLMFISLSYENFMKPLNFHLCRIIWYISVCVQNNFSSFRTLRVAFSVWFVVLLKVRWKVNSLCLTN